MSTALGRVAPPLVLGAVVLLVWQLVVEVGNIDAYVLPSPADILGEITAYLPVLVSATVVTGVNALVGLVVGTVLGAAFAVAASTWRALDELVAPLVAVLAVIPIVALAPVLYTMFGAGEQTARQVVASVAVYVPVFVTTLRGLRQTTPVQRDLMRAYAATRRQVMRAVRLPAAVPFLATGVRIASSLAVISALVAEYFGGPRGGLGSYITSSAAQSDYARAWSYVVAAVVLGLVFYVGTTALETYVLARRRR
ncbi:binding-protein-dependent transport systems inner membrane component [Beutenbergia cavernae DSM 12333]|uniref:Binding-protein-dependent transport systems inner membrane component n=1 Tax=Beutenbergia cavernae (strain ATCC BAA-8 / DSM 12333 / CCUG 43141 / JCM 11478 / NBRC 16432 / NCIMB 13614 / HKI 0122) TaxID=471853 RepID=C5BXD6_BEUC1|nr:ABC transporter permease subunit [Beutenbergia cavernae]ACQ80819.1 binding-protein-dependent transport systems inner membrane component [Beutenbergia cavernae DSM 12333]